MPFSRHETDDLESALGRSTERNAALQAAFQARVHDKAVPCLGCLQANADNKDPLLLEERPLIAPSEVQFAQAKDLIQKLQNLQESSSQAGLGCVLFPMELFYLTRSQYRSQMQETRPRDIDR